MIILSYCIPSYNRSLYLYKCLVSIASQATKFSEIVVIDDCSEEDIDNVISKFKLNYPKVNIFYKRNRNRLGFDRNLIKCVKNARGKYCWLVGNDDIILKNSEKEIVPYLKDDVFVLMNYFIKNFKTNEINIQPVILSKKSIKYQNQTDFFFHSGNSKKFPYIGKMMLTMSSSVFPKKVFMYYVKKCTKYIGTNMVHIFVFTLMLQELKKLFFIGKPKFIYLDNHHREWSSDIWKVWNDIYLPFMVKNGYPVMLVNKLKVMRIVGILKDAIVNNKFGSRLFRIYSYYFKKEPIYE